MFPYERSPSATTSSFSVIWFSFVAESEDFLYTASKSSSPYDCLIPSDDRFRLRELYHREKDILQSSNLPYWFRISYHHLHRQFEGLDLSSNHSIGIIHSRRTFNGSARATRSVVPSTVLIILSSLLIFSFKLIVSENQCSHEYHIHDIPISYCKRFEIAIP